MSGGQELAGAVYVTHYRLDSRPFQLIPDPRFFFASRAHREALADLVRALEAAEGLLLLVGPVGVGKTMLVDYLLAQLRPANFKIGRLAVSQSMSARLGPAILEAFDQVPHKGSQRAWRRRLVRFLRTRATARRRVLLIIDEAQNLDSAGLEELRAVVDLADDGRPLLQVLMVAQPEIRARLRLPELEAFRQRLVMVREVGPLLPHEVGGYIEHRLRTVGWTGRPAFQGAAFDAIFRHSQGVPRAINMLCARLLVRGAADARDRFDEQDVAAAADVSAAESIAVTGATGLPTRDPAPGLAVPPPGRPAAAERVERPLRPVLEARPGSVEAELTRLRRQLRQIELDRLKTDAELARRLILTMERPAPVERGRRSETAADARREPHFA